MIDSIIYFFTFSSWLAAIKGLAMFFAFIILVFMNISIIWGFLKQKASE